MTPDEIEAERERFWEWRQQQPRGQGDSEIWLARAEIAHAREAELRAENERLRELVREFAKNELYAWLQESYPTAKMAWKNVPDRILGLACEAGVWFDDDGNEVPLAEWRAAAAELAGIKRAWEMAANDL